MRCRRVVGDITFGAFVGLLRQAKLAADSKDGALVLENVYSPEGLSQTVSLAPGHYLLRALAKTNVFQIHLVAESTRMPVAVGDEYALAITDPDLIYKQSLAENRNGSVTMSVNIPTAGAIRILARVRGMSALERASYTTGWPVTGEAARGSFTIRIGGKQAGAIPVEGLPWRWVALDAGAVPLAAGVAELEVATRDAGIAIDHLLVTNDPSFVPRGRGQVPDELAAVPQGLRAVPFVPEDERALCASPKDQRPRVKLVWEEVSAPQGVSHYNVYRSDTEAFPAEAETLLGSPSGRVFYDVGLEAGQTVYYRVRAVDAWGNRSLPSAAMAVTN